MKNIILLAASLFVSSVLFAQQPASLRKAPEVTLKDTSGQIVKLSSLKGKVVLIDFWASWCGPCRRANKHLKQLYAKYKDQGFEIYSISTDDSKSEWKKAIKQDKTTWLHVLDEMNVSNTWQIRYLPTTFLLDKEGNFAAYDPDMDKLDGLIKNLLK
jgi:thiol-disulfide isomerase/thioredoxin